MTEDNLRRVAKSLMQEEPTYWGDFPEAFLMAWLADRHSDRTVVCAYCDLPLMSTEPTSFRHGTVDHLLPKSRYRQLELDQLNIVPCCYRCNAVKGRWDPNERDPVYSQNDLDDQLTKEQRDKLKARTRDYVHKKLETAHPHIWQCWISACKELEKEPEMTVAPGVPALRR
jgi:hypothetical protein